jgi:threonylcarbamoyladenosine tRNA methylthiotransferase MtaB
MQSVAFITIGCKLNRFETEQMRELAQQHGFVCSETDRGFDVCVVNTCTVTSKSDYRSRQAVRRAIKANPDARIVVTGCYAQRCPEEVASIKGVDAVVGNLEKEKILRYLADGKRDRPVVEVSGTDRMQTLPARTRLHRFGGYTRAFIKIQDGCDNRCSYCAVPLARGGSRSKRPEDIKEEIEVLVDEGFREVVLTGVHLGAYGRDLGPPTSLAGLLEEVALVPGLRRVRLSSIEPTDFSDCLIEMMADRATKICPHVHVPLQSGDDGVLRRMGRPYTRGFYSKVIRAIARFVPDCGIGADVMVGFPGEDVAAFENTRNLVEDLPLTYLHVFAFSRRSGTRAALLEGGVAPEEKKARSKILRDLGRAKSEAFRKSLEGKTIEVLVLDRKAADLRVGLSGNYVKTYLRGPVGRGQILSARVKSIYDDGVLAYRDGSPG